MRKKTKYLIYRSCLLLLILNLFCIVRNNPWDPVNGCPDALKADYRKQFESDIKRFTDNILDISKKYDLHISEFSSNKLFAEKVFLKNDSLLKLNSSIQAFNDSIENYNKTCTSSVFALKKLFTVLDTVDFFLPDSIGSLNELAKLDSLEIVAAIAKGNDYCQPFGIYSRAQIDSILAPAELFSKKRDSMAVILNKYYIPFTDTNAAIQKFNQVQIALNKEIIAYNDSIRKIEVYIKNDLINNIDTLIKRIDSIKSGDTLYLGAGYFRNSQLVFKKKADKTDPIVIFGSPAMNTFLDSMNIIVSECSGIHFVNLVFQNAYRGGSGCGIKIEANSQDIRFTDCIFRNNPLYGVEAAASSLHMENCIVTDNRMGGIKIVGGQLLESTLLGINLLITNNGDFGIYSTTAAITLYQSTISDNAADGVFLNVPRKQSSFNLTIFSYNGRSGIAHDFTEEINGTVLMWNCDFYQNAYVDIDIVDKFFASSKDQLRYDDPAFVNRAAGDYRVSDTGSIYNLNIGYKYKE